ncbi:hypothetical protein BY996DRAFT_8402186 [Phakopsora pachyrhizi]|nr:hypothetical protein BY996DRAFT_8402186 [Phakopsora pachyrhizi]
MLSRTSYIIMKISIYLFYFIFLTKPMKILNYLSFDVWWGDKSFRPPQKKSLFF